MTNNRDNTVEGFENYETFSLAIALKNDRILLQAYRELISNEGNESFERNIREMADAIQDNPQDFVKLEHDLFWTNLFGQIGSLWRVNFNEVAAWLVEK